MNFKCLSKIILLILILFNFLSCSNYVNKLHTELNRDMGIVQKEKSYNKFDFLYNNGINYVFAEMASNDSYNLNQNKIDKLIEIYKFIIKLINTT